ncbi:hypothetical protein H4S06_006201, partial [Coemansia sp. BCRC 34490]
MVDGTTRNDLSKAKPSIQAPNNSSDTNSSSTGVDNPHIAQPHLIETASTVKGSESSIDSNSSNSSRCAHTQLNKKYGSINTVPPFEDTPRRHSMVAAAAASIAELTSPTRSRPSLDESNLATPLVSDSERRASVSESAPHISRHSSYTSLAHAAERPDGGEGAQMNPPFTYSNVFSQGSWGNADNPEDENDQAQNSATTKAGEKRAVSGVVTNGRFSVREASSSLARNHTGSNAFVDMSTDDEDSDSLD